MNFFKLYIGDYQRDTAHLSLSEHGAFLLLLQHYYATEKPLPIGKALHRMLRAQGKAEQAAIDSIAHQFWRETPDGLVNDRADVEIKKAAAQADTNARIAREREERRKASRIPHEQSTNRATNDQPNHSHSHSQKTTSSNSINTSSTPYSHHSAIRLNGSHSAGLPKPEAPPDCPQQRIRDLWAELMPELQQPVKWTPARATTLRARWREEADEHSWAGEDDGLKFFAKLFRWCRKSDFLMGRAPARPGTTAFSLTVPWLIKAENWAKVQEGNYHPES